MDCFPSSFLPRQRVVLHCCARDSYVFNAFMTSFEMISIVKAFLGKSYSDHCDYGGYVRLCFVHISSDSFTLVLHSNLLCLLTVVEGPNLIARREKLCHEATKIYCKFHQFRLCWYTFYLFFTPTMKSRLQPHYLHIFLKISFLFQGKISPANQVLMKPTSTLKHVKLIPLAAAKSLEDLTKAFPVVSNAYYEL